MAVRVQSIVIAPNPAHAEGADAMLAANAMLTADYLTTTVTFTFSEPIQDGSFTLEDVKGPPVQGSSLSNLRKVSGTVYTATLTAEPGRGLPENGHAIWGQGLYVYHKDVSDAQGNPGSALNSSEDDHMRSNSYAVGTLRIAVTSITLADTNLTAGETTTVTFTFNKSAKDGFDAGDIDLSQANCTLVPGSLRSTAGSDHIFIHDHRVWTATLRANDNVQNATGNVIRVNQVGVHDDNFTPGVDHSAPSAAYTVDTVRPELVAGVDISRAHYFPDTDNIIASGNQLTLRYDEVLDRTHKPDKANFTVTVYANSIALADGVANPVTAVDVDGDVVVLTLFNPVTNVIAVTVSYNDPTAGNDDNAIQDAAGNDAVSFSNEDVTIDAKPPTIGEAFAIGYRVEIPYNERLRTTDTIDPRVFTVLVDGVTATIVDMRITNDAPSMVPEAARGSFVLLTLASRVPPGADVRLLYKKPATGPGIRDMVGNEADNADRTVRYNWTEGTPPVLSSAKVTGNELVLTYTEEWVLEGTGTSPGAFTVLVNGVANAVTSVTVNSGNVRAPTKTVTLRLSQPVTGGERVTVAYTKPATGPFIQDNSGNPAADTTTPMVVTPGTPTNPGGTTPTNPEGTPTNPGGTTPTNPGGTTPTNPGGTTPTNPGGTTPTNPGGTTPTNPGGTTPTTDTSTNPGGTTPTNPGGTTPTNPGGTTPTNPGGTTPTNPGGTTPTTDTSTNPGGTTPTNPGGTTPTNPGGTTPTNPGGTTPTNPGGTTPTTDTSTNPGGTTPTNPGGTTPTTDTSTNPGGTTPTNPGGTTPTNPGGTTPTNPGGTTPTNPGGTTPTTDTSTNPGGTTPTNPGGTTPTNPGGTTPTNPGGTTPTNPGGTTPTTDTSTNPGGTTPTNPGGTTPTDPGGTTPTNPGGTTPTNPGGTTPTDPGGTTPTNPGGTTPTNPGGTTPTNPGGTTPTTDTSTNPGGTTPTNPGGTTPTNPGDTPTTDTSTNPGGTPTNPGGTPTTDTPTTPCTPTPPKTSDTPTTPAAPPSNPRALAPDDNDCVPTILEDRIFGIPGPGGASPLTGDGNGDGIKDSKQSAVASLDGMTLVVSSHNGTPLSSGDSVRVTSMEQKGAPASLPKGLEMPIGLLSFETTLAGAPGSTESFSLYVDRALGINGYWVKDGTGVWVNLASETYGGKMETEGGRLRLDFKITDGGQFDADGIVDGLITAPGTAGHMQLSIVGQPHDLVEHLGFWF